MTHQKHNTHHFPLFILIILLLTACGNNSTSDLTPTPTPDYVHCGAQNLINAIHKANVDPDPSTLILMALVLIRSLKRLIPDL